MDIDTLEATLIKHGCDETEAAAEFNDVYTDIPSMDSVVAVESVLPSLPTFAIADAPPLPNSSTDSTIDDTNRVDCAELCSLVEQVKAIEDCKQTMLSVGNMEAVSMLTNLARKKSRTANSIAKESPVIAEQWCKLREQERDAQVRTLRRLQEDNS